MRLRLDLVKARSRADACPHASPSWAAQIEQVEDLERQILVLDQRIATWSAATL
ncbi:MAG: hypothetical protein ACXWXR_10025 [Candidatus Limnocylindrales bacterium]